MVLAVASVVVCVACSSTLAESAAPPEGRARASGESTASDRWMRTTRTIVGRREVGSPLLIARNYALVAVAEFNASVRAGDAVATAGRKPSEAGAVAAASEAVLRALYPQEDTTLSIQLTADRAYFATVTGESAYDFAAGERIGKAVAAQVLARAIGDRTSAVWTGAPPAGVGVWVSAPSAQPVAPLWGQSKGWFLSTGDQFRPVAPPPITSAAFASALAEVRTLTSARTTDQLTLAQFWQFASGPAGPIGHFAELAGGLAFDGQYNERRTARVYALLNMAIMDATISCWDAKYAYWYLRPFQADSAITTPVGRPNFPAYPSAHSCIVGAAAAILVGIFPASKTVMDGKLVDAGVSRIYAGLHYRFDITAGNEIGAKVAALALTRIPAINAEIALQ